MSFEHWARKFLLRLRVGQFLQVAAEWLAIFLLSFGTLVLLVKLMIPALWPHVLWLGLGAVPLTVAAWFVAFRETFSPTESVAYLDKKLNAGGLLMTLSEAPDEEWQKRLPQSQRHWQQSLPRFRPVRFARLIIVPLLFCVACGFIPLREIPKDLPAITSNSEKNLTELQEQFEKLKEEEIIDKEESERIEEELKVLMQQQNDPLTHEKWETVDALWDKMQMRVDQKTLSVAKAQQAAAALAKSSNGEGQPLTPEQWDQLAEQLQSGLSTLSASSQKAGVGKQGAMSDKLSSMLKSGKLNLPKDPKELAKTLSELKDLLEAEEKKLCEMSGQCKSGQCKNGQCNGYSLAEMLANCNKPGKGGVTRGPGAANLNFSHETDEQGAKFKETVLPKGFLDEPNDEIVSTTLAPPLEETIGSAPRGPERLSDPSTGKATWSRKISPKHRTVVKDYFKTEP